MDRFLRRSCRQRLMIDFYISNYAFFYCVYFLLFFFACNQNACTCRNLDSISMEKRKKTSNAFILYCSSVTILFTFHRNWMLNRINFVNDKAYFCGKNCFVGIKKTYFYINNFFPSSFDFDSFRCILVRWLSICIQTIKMWKLFCSCWFVCLFVGLVGFIYV